MVEGKRVYPELIEGFAGEQRTLPENLLPGNVSPDGLNIDYRDGTVRKRRGLTRLGLVPALQGGVRFNRFFTGTAHGRGYARSATTLTLSASLQTYNFLVSSTWVEVNGDVRVFVHETSGGAGTGLWLKNDAGTYRWEARCAHSGGTLAVTAVASASNALGSFTLIQLSFNTSTKTLTLVVDGVTASGTLGANTYTQPASYVYLGGVSTQDYDKNFIISQVRIWDGTVAALLAAPYRDLTTAERTAALKVWWNMATVESGAMANVVTGPALNLYGISLDVSVGAVLNTQSADPILAIVAKPMDSSGIQYVFARTQRAVYYGVFGHPLSQCIALQGTDSQARLGLGARGFRGQLLNYQGYAVALNGVGENLAGAYQLSYDAPVMSGALTITAAGSGGSINAGAHSYLFSIYNSTTGVESAVGTEISTQTAVANDKFTIDFTSGGFMPSRYYAGADKIRIYRTKAAGTVYYHLTDVDIDTTSYQDSAADSTLVTLRPTYVGYAAPSRFGFELNSALWLGNQEGYESRLVYTEVNSLGGFYAENYIDVGSGDGDALTGGLAIGDRGVVFKRRSTWLVTGAGDNVSVQKLFPGVGCVQHATIAASHDTVYFLGEGGVYAMPLPLGSGAPVNLTLGGWREFFSGLGQPNIERCSAVWDGVNERYLLSVPLSGGPKMMVYCARRQAWAYWNMGSGGVGGFCVTEDDDATPVILSGVANWVGRFGEGLSDADYVEGAAPRLQGTVTSGSSTGLTDSGAAWTTDLFSGMYVTLVKPDGTRLNPTYVVGNTATSLQVASWVETPAAGWTYILGAIDGHWRSPAIGLGRWDQKKAVDRVRVLNRVPTDSGEAASSVTVYVEPDGETSRRESNAHVMSAKVSRYGVSRGLCRSVVVGVEDVSATKTFDIAGFALSYMERDNDD